MKRWIALALCLMVLLSTPVIADDFSTDQVIDITLSDSEDTLNFRTKNPTTFWESPTIQPGETVIKNGTLTLNNLTGIQQTITFRSVELPYDNEKALEYLNHITLVLKQDDSVLYKGPYSRVNDDLELSEVLSSGASVTYTMELSCDYTYTGNTYVNDAILQWTFDGTLPKQPEEPKFEPFFDPLLWQWLTAGICTALITVVLFLSRRRSRNR